MNKINSGGPAFPYVIYGGEPGMSLRDYFAGQALMGINAAYREGNNWPEIDEDPYKAVAEAAYRYADAMIKARREKQ